MSDLTDPLRRRADEPSWDHPAACGCESCSMLREAADRLDVLEAENARLREWIADAAHHSWPDCQSGPAIHNGGEPDPSQPCTCGLDALRDSAS